MEDAFERRLLELTASEMTSTEGSSEAQATGPQESMVESTGAEPTKGIDKSVLAVAAPRRYICGRKPSDPHHLRYPQPRALGRKASDEFAVPLCRVHHRAVHRARDERGWWQAVHIDPVNIARKLWKDTRIDEGRIEPEGRPQVAAPGPDPLSGGDVMERQGASLTIAEMLTELGACGDLSCRHRHRLCRSLGRWSPGDLANPQQTFSGLAASPLLRSHGKRPGRVRDLRGARFA